MRQRGRLLAVGLGLVILATMLASVAAYADVISWTDWTSATVGNPGVAQGTITLPGPSTLSVSYSGQVLSTTNTNNTSGGVSWGPASTFSGGTVGNPPNFRDIIGLQGGAGTGTNTVTFATPVVDPVMAIWSLGASGSPASFVFGADEPFTVQSGGPSNEFGGSSITALANVVSGAEGNGTIQFSGTFTQLQWTNPQAEFWYGFTVGIAGAAPGPGPAVPEPSTLVLLGSGLAGLGGILRRRRHQG